MRPELILLGLPAQCTSLSLKGSWIGKNLSWSFEQSALALKILCEKSIINTDLLLFDHFRITLSTHVQGKQYWLLLRHRSMCVTGYLRIME